MNVDDIVSGTKIIQKRNDVRSFEYKSDLRDCLICLKYLKENDMYEGQRIGIVKKRIPGFDEFPKGSYVLFMENTLLNMDTYIVEKPKREEYIKMSIDAYIEYGYLMNFVSHKLNNVPEGLVEDAVIRFEPGKKIKF